MCRRRGRRHRRIAHSDRGRVVFDAPRAGRAWELSVTPPGGRTHRVALGDLSGGNHVRVADADIHLSLAAGSASVRVLVVGATGSLGRATVDALEAAGHRVVVASPSTDPAFDLFADDPGTLLDRTDPDAVAFAAAVERSDVPRSEYDRVVERFVAACRDCRLVYVSSDAVFDGDRGRYAPGDGRSPRDEYGRRLVAFEDAVASHPDAAVLRSSYLYGGVDGLDPRLSAAVDALRGDGTYERYADMYRSPAHVVDVGAALRSLLVGSARGVLHVPGPRLSVYEFHRRALSALGVPTEGLVRDAVPEGADVARDRSLVAERFRSVTGVPVRPPEAALDGERPDERYGGP